MRRSEIFDSFVKIAQEKGMISNDSSDSKKKLEQTGRADSLDASAIEALYGVKPDTAKGMAYDLNIMETAHPNSVVVSPSYDKLNGLVENNIERQNILLHIVNKTPDGLSTQRKYAEKELTLALVRLANNLDNKNEDKLRTLADSCLMQLTASKVKKSLKKEALAPLVIAAIAAAVIGAIYAHNHLDDFDNGLNNNYANLVKQLDDFLKDNNSGLGIKGHTYSPELLKDVTDFKARLKEFYDTYTELDSVIRELERPKDAKELLEISQRPKTHTVINAVNRLRKLADNMSSFIDIVSQNFSSSSYKSRHVKSKGLADRALEYTHLVGGKDALFADDFQDVVNAIPAFKKSIGELLKVMEDAKSIEDKSAADLSAAQAKAKEDFGGGTGDLSAPISSKPNKTVSDLDKEADELSKMLGNS